MIKLFTQQFIGNIHEQIVNRPPPPPTDKFPMHFIRSLRNMTKFVHQPNNQHSIRLRPSATYFE